MRRPSLLPLLFLAPLAAQRASVALRIGHTEACDLRLPHGPPDRMEGATGVWEATLTRPQATWLRVEPVVLHLLPGAELRVGAAGGGEVDRFEAGTPARWSRAAAGGTLRIELRAQVAAAGSEVVIRRVGVGSAPPPTPQAVCPGSTLLPIACSATMIPTLPNDGRAVARLNLLWSDGSWYLGTGFNADLTAYGGNASQFMLTAGHNVADATGVAVFIEAQYLATIAQNNCAAPVRGDRCAYAAQIACAWAAPSPTCDWAVVAFGNQVGALYGSLTLNGVPTPRSVAVVQHPLGRCQEYSTGFYPNLAPPCELAHTASTEPGSSGSPVFAFFTGNPGVWRVIGVHVSSSPGPACPNFATTTDAIFPLLTPALLQGLLTCPSYTVLGTASGAIGGCTPRLVAHGVPTIGSSWALATLTIPSTAVTLFWLGNAFAPPAPPWYVAPDAIVGPLNASGPGYPCDGHAGFPIPVPSSTFLRGIAISAQSLVFQGGSYVLTNGLTATIQ